MSPAVRLDAAAVGDTLLARCDALAALTEDAGCLTRTYLTPRHAEATALVAEWMTAAGMAVRVDPLGNLIGRYEGARPGAPAVVIGSHLDTVRDAGRYDGMLGVVTGIAVVEALHRAGRRLPVAVEVVPAAPPSMALRSSDPAASPSSPSLSPFLKAFTPLATSPMSRGILPAPNRTRTTSRTMIQCQMLKVPIDRFSETDCLRRVKVRGSSQKAPPIATCGAVADLCQSSFAP